MYNQSQRFRAIVLLFSIFLQNCTYHNKLNYHPQAQFVKQVYQKRHTQSDNPEKQDKPTLITVPVSEVTAASACLDLPVKSHIVKKLDASKKVITNTVNAKPSEECNNLLIDQLALTKSASTERNSSTIDKPHAMTLVKQAPIVSNNTFSLSSGQKVCFLRQDAIWQAQVTDPCPGNDYISMLPVICQGAENIQQFLKILHTQKPNTYKYRIHILEANQVPYARKCVYLGELGIKGGMQEEKEIAFPLHQAAEQGDIARVMVLLQEGKYDINERDAEGYTPLERAAQNGHYEIENILLHTGPVANPLMQEKTYRFLYTSKNEAKDKSVPTHEQTIEIDKSMSIEMSPLYQAAINSSTDEAALIKYEFFPTKESFTKIEALHENRLTYLSQMSADNWPITQSSLEKIKGRVSARTDRPDCYKKTKQFLQIAVPALCTGALVFFPVQSLTGKWLAFVVGGGANTLSVAMAWYWASKESREENYLQNTVKEYQEIYKDLAIHLLNTMDSSIDTRKIAYTINHNFPLIKTKFLELFSKEDTETILNQLETTVDYLSQQSTIHFDPKSDKFLALDESCKQMVQNKYYEKKINHCIAEIAALKQKQD